MNLKDKLGSMILFDVEEEGSSGVVEDNEQTTQTSKDIKKELDDMLGEVVGTATPVLKSVDEIDLDDSEGEGGEEEEEEKTTTEGEEEIESVEGVEETELEKPEKDEKEKEKKPVDETEAIRNDFNEFARTQLRAAGITEESALASVDEEGQKTETTTATTTPAPQKTTPSVDVEKIEITDELWEDLRDNKEAFSNLLNEYGKKIASAVKEQVLLEAIPATQKYSRNYISSVQAVENFYSKNPELNDYRPVVGFISAKLGQADPTLSREDLMNKTGKEAYRLLRLSRGKQPPSNGATSDRTKPPAFAQAGTRRGKPGEKVFKNKIAKDLAEMMPKR